jgi:hypothetical protein
METYELIEEVMRREAVRSDIMIALACILAGIGLYMIIVDLAERAQARRARKAARRAMDEGTAYVPTVTGIERDGYRLMGSPRPRDRRSL